MFDYPWDEATLSILGKGATAIIESAEIHGLAGILETFFETFTGGGTHQGRGRHAGIDNLVTQIRASAYQDALGIYNAMTTEIAPSQQSVLQLVYKPLLDRNLGALDLYYGMVKSFSTKRLLVTQTVATLLTFAAKASKDVALQSLADAVLVLGSAVK
ncbi:unnamed protein product [Cyclocybe aegerita]|uniref:Uncharacterized protein n=1 Tax=Cyclocybe aegerita TaxID=1973307 RepID=A0A8S0WSJ1_CYCAE|nr:unnamed protein product [Cyclocybe aegerita]